MKRVILAVVSTVASLVLLLSFKTHSPSAVATPPAAVSTTTNSGSTGPSPATTTKTKAKSKATTKSSTSTSNLTKTYTGSAAYTRYGPVQVRVTVSNGKVAKAEAVVYPMGSALDQQINSYAIPQLNSEASSASSANIDMVSGATFTSQGYIASLQSALDQAGL